MTAARYANLSSVKLLVRYGADVNMKSRWGRTALDDARKYNKQPRVMDKRDVVAFLEDAGQVRGGISSPHLLSSHSSPLAMHAISLVSHAHACIFPCISRACMKSLLCLICACNAISFVAHVHACVMRSPLLLVSQVAAERAKGAAEGRCRAEGFRRE